MNFTLTNDKFDIDEFFQNFLELLKFFLKYYHIKALQEAETAVSKNCFSSSSHRRCSLRKGDLKICSKFTGEHP